MLDQLIKYGQSHGITGEAGFSPKMVRWLLQFTETGEFLGVVFAGDAEDRRSKGRELPKAPHLQFAGDTPMRQFLVDTAQYALLYDHEPPADGASAAARKAWDKLLAKHAYFLDRLRDAGACDPVFMTLADALSNEQTRLRICEQLASQTPSAKPADNVTFAIDTGDGARIPAEQDYWHDWWRDYLPALFKKKAARKAKEPVRMRCFLTGELVEPALTHPKVKGLGDVGGNIETTLVGFNLDAFTSYGLKQSANAAIGGQAAQQYAAAINELISHRSKRLVGAKVVYWYTGPVREKTAEDPLAGLFDPSHFGLAVPSDGGDRGESSAGSKGADVRREGQALTSARELLDAIQSGERAELRDARYCAMTLSGNAGRVVVRDWMEGSFESLLRNVDAWFEDLAIVRRDGDGIVQGHKFGAVLAAPFRELSDAPGPTSAALWRCAVGHQPIPHELMAQTLGRVRIDITTDQPLLHARFGLLKAYCKRKEICSMKSELDETNKHPAYLCGRIMAVLASIQRKALGDVGAGVVQRYYAAASATPALVLGRLVRQAQVGHLPKIEGGLGHWFESLLAEIWDQLDTAPPSTLTLEQQTLFAMGYYQQKAKRYSSKKNTPPTDVSDTE